MIDLSELQDSAQKAFPSDKLVPERHVSWALVAEMGWLMIELPEDQGGLGLGRDAAATIHYELGKMLSSAPLIPAMLALRAIYEAENFVGKESWIESICGGEYVPLNMLPGKLEAAADGSLTGKVSGFFDADMASHVLIGASGRYLLVPTDAPGVRMEERPLWDESRRLFDLHLDGYAPHPSLCLAEGAAAAPLHDSIARSAHLFVAADSLGGATAGLDMTVEYLKMRKQFDRPLAMFQALKHRCADLKSQIVSAEALLWSRATSVESVNVTALGAMKGYATDTYRIVTEEMIQLHGGIGLTEEHPCHLFMKRAMLNLQLCGSLDHWREMAGREALNLR
jgi:alkylation response protein AidB-like acyl-CoA dehydrogenase